MRRLTLLVAVTFGAPCLAQEPVATPPEAEAIPINPLYPEAFRDRPPTLGTVAPRMQQPEVVWLQPDPRTIFFKPYFFPTHYNFRPLPYGYPPSDPGFFYGTYANPYYLEFYGPGDYWGF